MQIIILIGLCAECILLAALALFRKMTGKAFIGISAFTLAGCLAAVFMSGSYHASVREMDQREFIYMAARLLQDGHSAEAIQALGEVVDEENEAYKVRNLRGLSYNLNGDFQASILILQEEEDSLAQAVCIAAGRQEPVEDGTRDEIINGTIEALHLDEHMVRKLEAQMQLRFLASYQAAEEDLKAAQAEGGARMEALQAIRQNEYEKAYEIMSRQAEGGALQDVIIVSNMYLYNYNQRTLAESDPEYDRLWQKATDAQTRLGHAAAQMGEQNGQDVQDMGLVETDEKDGVYKAYESARAEYEIAMDELNRETVKRAINYVEANEPPQAGANIAYQFQRALLYYLAGERETAAECLSRIFAGDTVDQGQWLGINAYLLRESYLESMSAGNLDGFEALFTQTLNALSQNMFQIYQRSFMLFVEEYLDGLFKGLRIGDIDTSAFPQVMLEVSTSEKDLILSEGTMLMTDTQERIESFQVVEKEMEGLSLCFVLDRSGSMEGARISDAKRAIRDSVMSLEEDTIAGLVSFDDMAQMECAMTVSKYAISSVLGNINPRGGTNIAAGLKCANDMLAGTPGERVIILLSDGSDGERDLIQGVLDQLVANDIMVFTIGVEGCVEDYLRMISDSTGGTFIPVSNTNRLTQVYEEIQSYLAYTYYVTYTAVGQTEDRDVHLRMKDSLVQVKKNYSLAEKEEADVVQEEQVQRSDYFRQMGGAAHE